MTTTPTTATTVDRFFCGGRWDAGLLADMTAANDAC
jgi:hypothetical protein